MAEALLALGGNVGDARATLDRAVTLLCDGKAVRLIARSSDYRTPRCSSVDSRSSVRLDAIAAENSAGARARSISTFWPMTM